MIVRPPGCQPPDPGVQSLAGRSRIRLERLVDQLTALDLGQLGVPVPRLRQVVKDTLLDLVYGDPLQAWDDVPVIELSGPLDGRLAAALAALQAQ